MAIEKTYQYDVERNVRVDASGDPLQMAPLLFYQSYEEWKIIFNKMVSGTLTAQDVSDGITWECSIFTNWTSGYVAGALTAGFSGAVTAITADGFASAPPDAGYLLMTNGAGEQDAVFYTAWTLDGTTYTFTVSATLDYTYLENDVCSFESSPPSLRTLNADIDSTDAATGIIKPLLDTDNPVFLSDIGGAKFIAGWLELKGYSAGGNRVHYLLIGIELHSVGDPNVTTGSLPATAYYTKTQSDARYAQLSGTADIEITDATKGLILKGRTNSNRYRFFIYDADAANPIISVENVT